MVITVRQPYLAESEINFGPVQVLLVTFWVKRYLELQTTMLRAAMSAVNYHQKFDEDLLKSPQLEEIFREVDNFSFLIIVNYKIK